MGGELEMDSLDFDLTHQFKMYLKVNMRVNRVVTSFQVAAMGNAHLGLAATTLNLLREICCLGGVTYMADLQVGKSQQAQFLMIRIRVIENVYGTQVRASFYI